ncbi:MAG: hypothetical protein K6F56_03055 [Oscillospiraceae bacterium]|nr:hypothetical protein [Oscillospiraceae bacterium]
MLGRQKCKILKEIRQRIADENDIPYVTSECSHQGACSGTCPRCESELRYLERQLERRAALGRKVSVAALCAGLALVGAGCAPISHGEPTPDPGQELSGAMLYEEPTPEPTPEIFVTEGEVAWTEEPETDPDEEPGMFELTGDVAYVPETDG